MRTKILLPMALVLLGACSAQTSPVMPVRLKGDELTDALGAVKSTVVILPDTQHYTRKYIQHLESQVDWLLASKDQRKIDLAITVGDIVQNNTEDQWQRAQNAFQRLDGVVPYIMTFGNHDYGDNGKSNNRQTLGNQYFSSAEYPTQQAAFEPNKLDNTAHVVEIAGKPWLILSLEWGPRNQVVNWAKKISASYSELPSMMVTHAFLYSNGKRYAQKADYMKWNPHDYPVSQQRGGVNDGEELWNKFVDHEPRMDFVFSGHVLNDGLGYRNDLNTAGHAVHQMAVNFQMAEEGGMGYLRILEFLDDEKTVQVKTYSPVLDRFLRDDQNEFTLTL